MVSHRFKSGLKNLSSLATQPRGLIIIRGAAASDWARTTQPRGLIIIRGAAASDWASPHLASVSSAFSFKAQLSSALLLLFMRAMDECKIEVNDDVQPRTVMQQRGHSPEDSFSAKMVRRTPMILEQAGHRCSCLSLESNAPRTCCIKPRVACVHGCQNGTLG